jgi:hypothetical protein
MLLQLTIVLGNRPLALQWNRSRNWLVIRHAGLPRRAFDVRRFRVRLLDRRSVITAGNRGMVDTAKSVMR